MQSLFEIADTLSKMDIEEEMVTFLCSVIAFFILIAFRNQSTKAKKSGKLFKHIELNADDGATTECDAGLHDDKHYVKIDKALRTAFETEDYWQVLKCWGQLKHFNQSSIHLSMIVRSMRFCNKGGFFIATELKNFFKAHPQECSIGLVNDLLEPLARRSDDEQLVDLLVKMIPSINLTKDSRTYEIMLTMHATNGNLAKTQSVMAEMNIKEVAFTPRATVAVMTMGLQMGNADVVLKAFIKLKPVWDERATWAVSMFALVQHKTNVLVQVVTLACEKLKASELSAALDGMTLPAEVLDALQAKLSLLSDTELAASIEVLEKSGRDLKTDLIYNTMIGCSISSANMKAFLPCKAKKPEQADSQPLPPWKAKKLQHEDSDVSTSDGSKSVVDEVIDCSPSPMRSLHSDSCRIFRSMKNDNRADECSTSEGSRSDSEEESNFGPCARPPPGLALPGF